MYRVTASQQTATGAPPTWLVQVEDLAAGDEPVHLGWCYQRTIDAVAAVKSVGSPVDHAEGVEVVVELPTRITTRLDTLRACQAADPRDRATRTRANFTRYAVCQSLAAMGVEREDVDLIFRLASTP